MKRVIYITLLIFVLTILVGCESTEPIVEQDIKIDVIDMEGAGTVSSPYITEIKVGESFNLKYTVTPHTDNKPNYVFVKRDEQDFVNLRSKDLKGLSLVESDNQIVITGLIPGDNYIRMSIQNKSVYIQVNVTENEYMKKEIDFTKELKVLAIGNSFSDDGMEFLYDIAHSFGVENIVLGNLVIGGATLETHVNAAAERSKAYAYRKNIDGIWTTQLGVTTAEGIADEDWDIITLQQGSGSSGMKTTYDPYLLQMIHVINAYKTNSYAQIYWHMTWAYEQSSTHSEFVNYNQNQNTMYEMIVDTYQNKIQTEERIAGIIPSGSAIQNTRTSFIGDNLTRDGYHLSYDIGRYVAGLTWFKAITGLALEAVSFAPMGISPTYVNAIKEAVNQAIENPLTITNSTYTETPTNDLEYSLENMVQVNPTFTVGYWHATLSHDLYKEAANSIYFLANDIRLTPEDLPIGSLLILKPGYQYRINYYAKDGGLLFNLRTEPITRDVVLITPYWWQDYGMVGINIFSTTPNKDISDEIHDVHDIFKIYIPERES